MARAGVTTDRVVDELKKANLVGEIMSTNLSAEAEQKLRDLAQA